MCSAWWTFVIIWAEQGPTLLGNMHFQLFYKYSYLIKNFRTETNKKVTVTSSLVLINIPHNQDCHLQYWYSCKQLQSCLSIIMPKACCTLYSLSFKLKIVAKPKASNLKMFMKRRTMGCYTPKYSQLDQNLFRGLQIKGLQTSSSYVFFWSLLATTKLK